MKANNIFKDIPAVLPEEFFQTIKEKNNIKIERIVSDNHSSPEGFYYNQTEDEFVILLKGSAQITFKDSKSILLNPGDYLIIPALTEHRVDWTSDKEKTVWLAFFSDSH